MTELHPDIELVGSAYPEDGSAGRYREMMEQFTAKDQPELDPSSEDFRQAVLGHMHDTATGLYAIHTRRTASATQENQ